jgi:coproporphyrinogen III oxidase
LRDGAIFEQAGVNFSHVTGSACPLRQQRIALSWPGAVSKPWGFTGGASAQPVCANQPCQCALFYC